MEDPKVTAYEPLTKQTLDMIVRTIGGIGATIARIPEADLSKGVGVIDRTTKCLWTKDRKRITISAGGGAIIASCSRDVDPCCPE